MRIFYFFFPILVFMFCFSTASALGAEAQLAEGKSTEEPVVEESKKPSSEPVVEATDEPVGEIATSGEPEKKVIKSYLISSGDLINVTVFGEPDLSLEGVRVASNGTISFPLLGEILIKGFSSAMLEKHLIDRLRDGYLKKPKVTVSILEYRMFYVNGEVHKPGGYKYVDGLTVQKAIALAGGFNERASKGKITLIRENFPDKPLHSVKLNIEVRPGDILTVGESFF